ncbi:MAG: ACT domain-containing protein [Acidimicrobiia bacterium]|nr:ACT domain-containing protein [Acidimicrobiia bacterium]
MRSVFMRVAGVMEPGAGTPRESLAEKLAAATDAPVGDVLDLIDSMGSGYLAAHTNEETAAHLAVMSRLGERPAAVASEGNVVTVVAPDHTGLLGEVAGVFAVHNISIHEAKLWTRPDGIALDTFSVSDVRSGTTVDPQRWDVILGDLEAAAGGELDLDALVTAKRSDYRRAIVARSVEVAAPPDPSQRYTVIEVRCADQPGALFTIVGALYRAGLDIQVARIETMGTMVRDTFFVRDGSGQPIRDVARLAQLTAAIRADLRTRL